MTDPPLIELRDAAAELGVHYQTAYRWVRSGQLPATMVAGKYAVLGQTPHQSPSDSPRFGITV